MAPVGEVIKGCKMLKKCVYAIVLLSSFQMVLSHGFENLRATNGVLFFLKQSRVKGRSINWQSIAGQEGCIDSRLASENEQNAYWLRALFKTIAKDGTITISTVINIEKEADTDDVDGDRVVIVDTYTTCTAHTNVIPGDGIWLKRTYEECQTVIDMQNFLAIMQNIAE